MNTMQHLPLQLYIFPLLITIASLLIYRKAVKGTATSLILMGAWIIIQSVLSLSGFYQVTTGLPPRFALTLLPPLVLMILLLNTKNGKRYADGTSIKWLTLLHTVRLPVELMLLALYRHKAIPEVMTFEGSNFDILSGITAPFIFYFGYVRSALGRRTLLVWNLLCLGLLINIVVHAILSAPFAFQQLGFEQPNIAIFYFPFTLLPCIIVPLVLWAHLVAIRQLSRRSAYLVDKPDSGALMAVPVK